LAGEGERAQRRCRDHRTLVGAPLPHKPLMRSKSCSHHNHMHHHTCWHPGGSWPHPLCSRCQSSSWECCRKPQVLWLPPDRTLICYSSSSHHNHSHCCICCWCDARLHGGRRRCRRLQQRHTQNRVQGLWFRGLGFKGLSNRRRCRRLHGKKGNTYNADRTRY